MRPPETPVAAPKSSPIAGGLLTAVERITAQVSQLAIFVAAARILTPAEFGVFSLVSACAILLLRVSEVGWAPYIMSWRGEARIPQQVLFIAVLSGLLMGAIGFAGGLVLLFVGFASDTSQLVHLFALWVVLATVSAAQKGILIWQDRLKSSAMIEIFGELTGLAVALLSLTSGFGVFALVFGRLAYQSVHLAVSFAATRMLPLPGMRGEALAELITFSWQIFTTRIVINFRVYVATFLIGGFLGPAAVGYYRAAERLVSALSEVIGVPSIVLAWSLFRQARDKHAGTTAGFQQQANLFFKVMGAVSIPVFIWLIVMREDLVSGLLGEEWLPALPVVAILACARAMGHFTLATEAVLSLSGQIKRLIPFTFLYFGMTVLLTLLGAQFGIIAVALSQVAVAFVILNATLWLYHRYAAINGWQVVRRAWRIAPPIAIGAVTLVVLRDLPELASLAPLVRTAIASLGTLVVYVLLLAAFEPELRQWVLRLRR